MKPSDSEPGYLNYCFICRWSGVAGHCPNCNGYRGLILYVRAESEPAAPESTKSHGMVLTADTYVPANPETGDRARIVATVAAPEEPSKLDGRTNAERDAAIAATRAPAPDADSRKGGERE